MDIMVVVIMEMYQYVPKNFTIAMMILDETKDHSVQVHQLFIVVSGSWGSIVPEDDYDEQSFFDFIRYL